MSEEPCGKLEFLKKASLYYKDICPEQSRFLMQRRQCMKAKEELDGTLCPFCSQWRQPDNHRVRMKPKCKASPLIRKILRREAARKRLSVKQLKTLRRFRNSCSTRGPSEHAVTSIFQQTEKTFIKQNKMATCHTCNKTSRSRGVSRDTVAALSKNQATPGKQKTAGRTSQPGSGGTLPKSSEKTPYGTPRSASSGSGSLPSSKLGDAKKSAIGRLRKVLMMSESPASKKGGLKAFLSSL